MENVYGEALGDAPGAASVGELWHAFVQHACGGEGKRPIDDVRVPGDPADIRHAPVDIVWMNVLVILGGSRNVGQIAASAMLAALGLAGGAAGVHQEERSFSILRDRLHDVVAIVL